MRIIAFYPILHRQFQRAVRPPRLHQVHTCLFIYIPYGERFMWRILHQGSYLVIYNSRRKLSGYDSVHRMGRFLNKRIAHRGSGPLPGNE